MSSVSFNPVAAQSVSAVDQASGLSPAQTQSAVPAAVSQDTVKLSEGAQVAQLYDSGQSVTSIASTLGLSASLVDSYLGLVDSSAVSVAGASVGGVASSAASSGSSTPSAETIQAAAAQIQTATADSTVKQALSVTA